MKKFIVVLLLFVSSLVPARLLAQTEVTCESDVVVQSDDWLSKIAEKTYGNPLAFSAIAQATNAKAAGDKSYATIGDVNVIEPGWKLCLPSAAEAQAMLGESAPAPSAAEVSAAEQKPLVILQGVEPRTLDPNFRTQLPEDNVLLSVFDPIISWTEPSMELTPGIVTEWNLVDDLTWEFKVREGVKAHNGEVINAEDVAYTFERTADPKLVGAGSYPEFILANIKYDRAEVVDEQTVRIHTKEPAPELPAFMWAMLVLPKDYYSSMSLEDAALKPMGSGPYKFVEWRKGEQLTLEANDAYWSGAPQAKQVIFRAVPEASSRLAELNTGGADLIVNVPPDLQSEVDANQARVVPVEGRRRIYIGFTFYGPNQEAVKDKRVRQALNYGFDFQKILDGLLGVGQRTGTFANPPFQDPSVKPYPYDPDKARALLKEAGFEDRDGDGFVDYPDGKPLNLTMLAPNGRYLRDLELAQAVGADLQQTGINVEVQSVEWTGYATQVANGEIPGDLFFYGAGGEFFCQGDLADWYGKSGWAPGKWLNAGFDTIFDKLISTVEPEQRQELCYQLQQYMHDEVPLIFLYFQVDYYGMSNRLDWTPSPTERIRIYNAKFK